MNFYAKLDKQRSEARALENNALDDRALMRAMMTKLRDALHAAINECDLLSVHLKDIDGEQLMADIRHEFDPESNVSPIQDAFHGAFMPTWRKRKGAHQALLIEKGELASGAEQAPLAAE